MKPLALLSGAAFGTTASKIAVFFGLRSGFAVASAFTEATLVQALARRKRGAESWVLLCLLATSSAMFVASTTFLPGTFSMYLFTLAAAGVLSGRTGLVIASCASSVILGWSVTAIAALPYAIWVLCSEKFARSFNIAMAWGFGLLLASFAFDSFFYGKQALSLYSFLSYNVFGSGDSALYGVEGPSYYFKNGAINLKSRRGTL